jgi:phosphonate metabolism protein PhnN/1,5-bisphosphokinase (PRPP-forming)
MSGRLVLIVGPSGSGKDTLLAGAADALADDPRFVFVRRAVTRPAENEDHETVSPLEFEAREARGDFALSWQAHGLSYGIPRAPLDAVARGAIVVANVSRSILDDASRRYATEVVEITAPEGIRAQRLSERRRETSAEISTRLARQVSINAETLHRVINDGTIEQGTMALVKLLRRFQSCSLSSPAKT